MFYTESNRSAARKGSILLPLISAIALLALLALVGAGYFFLQTHQPQSTFNNLKPTIDNIPSPSPTTVIGETANWKTYTNQKYNYKFKYPDNYELNEESTDKVVLSSNPKPDGSGFQIYFAHTPPLPGTPIPNEDVISLDDFARARLNSSQIEDASNVKIKKITKFGLDARFFEGVSLGYGHHYLVKPNPNLSFAVSVIFSSSEDVLKLEQKADQILATFKFL